jgi:transposase-like protein
METAIPEGLTVYDFPEEHRCRVRTSNVLERVSQEIKHRIRVVRLFPNQASCLRLVMAVLMEISEEWETSRIYLTIRSN